MGTCCSWRRAGRGVFLCRFGAGGHCYAISVTPIVSAEPVEARPAVLINALRQAQG